MVLVTETRTLAVDDFATLLGISADDLPNECVQIIQQHDFRYRTLGKSKQESTIAEIQKRIDSGELTISGKEAKPRWEKGWTENLESFTEKGYDIEELVPKYVKPNRTMRLFGEYIMPLDAHFELNWYTVFRHWFFTTYLKGADAIYEFGCGSGYNLPILAKLFPEAELHGLDWVAASRDIVNAMAEKYGWNMTGHIFDMFGETQELKMKQGSAALTLGGLEQLGENYHAFLEYLIGQKPNICIHMEPLVELYNPERPFDDIAIRFHKKRGYLGNIVSTLKNMEADGKIQMIKVHRVPLGSLHHEGYSYIVWRPLIV